VLHGGAQLRRALGDAAGWTTKAASGS
jgi:hypothetical protein